MKQDMNEKLDKALIRLISLTDDLIEKFSLLVYDYKQCETHYDVIKVKQNYRDIYEAQGDIKINEIYCKTNKDVIFIIKFNDVNCYIKLDNFDNRFECKEIRRREKGFSKGTWYIIPVCDLTIINQNT